MERYIEQLIEDLQAAHRTKGMPIPPKFESDNERTTTLMMLTGIDPMVFPPVEKLTKLHLQQLYQVMVELVESYHYVLSLPKRLPVDMAYPKLVDKWKDDIPCIDQESIPVEIQFCHCPKTCGMREWCDCGDWPFFDSQVIFENSENVPVIDGIYDDEGNKIDIFDIPVPDLCLSCESFLDDDWEENILCNLTRADKREEGEEFKCGAWRKKRI